MENLLPTLTIIMAEVALVLLVLLIVLLYRYGRRKRLHQAEIETLMEIAQERRITLPGAAAAAVPTQTQPQSPLQPPPEQMMNQPAPSTDAGVAVPDNTTTATDTGQMVDTGIGLNIEANTKTAAEIEPPSTPQETTPSAPTPAVSTEADVAAAAAAPSAPISDEVARDLSEIHHAMDLMDIKLAQIRHEHNKLALNMQRALEKASKERAAMHREVSAIAHMLSDLRRTLSLSGTAQAGTHEPPSAPVSLEEQRIAAAAATGAGAASTPAKAATPAPESKAQATRATENVPEDPDYQLDASTLDRLMNTAHFGGMSSTGIDVEEIDLGDLDLNDPHGMAQHDANRPFSQDADQIFFQSSTTANMKPGWYFSLRGGHPQGPFGDKQTAERVLSEMQGKTPRAGQATI